MRKKSPDSWNLVLVQWVQVWWMAWRWWTHCWQDWTFIWNGSSYFGTHLDLRFLDILTSEPISTEIVQRSVASMDDLEEFRLRTVTATQIAEARSRLNRWSKIGHNHIFPWSSYVLTRFCSTNCFGEVQISLGNCDWLVNRQRYTRANASEFDRFTNCFISPISRFNPGIPQRTNFSQKFKVQ